MCPGEGLGPGRQLGLWGDLDAGDSILLCCRIFQPKENLCVSGEISCAVSTLGSGAGALCFHRVSLCDLGCVCVRRGKA